MGTEADNNNTFYVHVPMPTLKDDERKENGTYECVIIATMCSLSK